jgi:hypothetical protein
MPTGLKRIFLCKKISGYTVEISLQKTFSKVRFWLQGSTKYNLEKRGWTISPGKFSNLQKKIRNSLIIIRNFLEHIKKSVTVGKKILSGLPQFTHTIISCFEITYCRYIFRTYLVWKLVYKHQLRLRLSGLE